MELLSWILMGIVINLIVMREDLITKDHFLSLLPLVGLRAVSGGLVSDYFFVGGIINLDIKTIILAGVAPLILLSLSFLIQNYEQLFRLVEKIMPGDVRNLLYR